MCNIFILFSKSSLVDDFGCSVSFHTKRHLSGTMVRHLLSASLQKHQEEGQNNYSCHLDYRISSCLTRDNRRRSETFCRASIYRPPRHVWTPLARHVEPGCLPRLYDSLYVLTPISSDDCHLQYDCSCPVDWQNSWRY